MDEQLECPSSEFYSLGKELTDSGISLRFRVRGQSMFPLIRDGDVAEIAPVSMDQVEVGDVVFFRAGSMLLAHRVVDRTVNGQEIQLVTRGDSHAGEDEPIRHGADLIGRVEAVYRGQRRIAMDRGLARTLGCLAARNQAVHWSMRWVGRMWWWGTWMAGRFLPRGRDRHDGTNIEVCKGG